VIRVATLDDVTTISDIRVRSWRFIYKGEMPDDHLMRLDPRASDARWRVMIDGTTPRSRILVAADGGPITGFIALEPANEKHFGYQAYLSAIYIEPEYIGRGLGRALFDAGCGWMREARYADVFWWVIGVNWRAIKFYEKLGATRVPGAEQRCDGDYLHQPEYGYGLELNGRQ
jgi:ribosomal protein S18 acetylase RimI-like enzyme